jgi:hypothetical protein
MNVGNKQSIPFGNDIGVSTKTPSLGVLSFRAPLNIAMLVTESDRAKLIRSKNT